nr:unnamed protein product [Spirometra erinaceieuropaei]
MQPDVISITENWLQAEALDAEIALGEYLILRRDRLHKKKEDQRSASREELLPQETKLIGLTYSRLLMISADTDGAQFVKKTLVRTSINRALIQISRQASRFERLERPLRKPC